MALFIGVGISAFYPQPKPPDYPKLLQQKEMVSPVATETAEMKAARLKFDKEMENYQKRIPLYNRNVSLISLFLSLSILVISLAWLNKLLIISDGILLGGVFTLAYSIIRGFGTEDEKYRFILVSIGLIVALILGYLKFIKSTEHLEGQ